MEDQSLRPISKDQPRHGWAPGKHFVKCSKCGFLYKGAKQSTMCQICAYELPLYEQLEFDF